MRFLFSILASVILWAVVILATWFAERADNALGHGPLPSGLDGLNAYLATLLVGFLGLLCGGVFILAVRGNVHFGRQYAWLPYVLVVLPLFLMLFVPLQRFGSSAFLGLPEFLVGIPGRMVIVTSLGALLIGITGITRLFPGSGEGASPDMASSGSDGSGARDGSNRFGPLARRAFTYMQDEAQRFEQTTMGTEHLLLGLLRDVRSQSARIVVSLGADPTAMRRELENTISRRGATTGGNSSMTQRCQTVLEQSVRIARTYGHRTVGTGHLLQALAEKPEDIASQLLESFGVTGDRVIAELRQLGPEAE